MKIRCLITVVLTLLGVSTLSAQRIDSLRYTLADRTIEGASVRVWEDAKTRRAVAGVEQNYNQSEVSGYRVVIFVDNKQYADQRAEQTVAEFKERYPDINTYLNYESPYFKVSVGDCLSEVEAMILCNRISGDYPEAFTRKSTILLTDLHNPKVVDSLMVVDSLQTFPFPFDKPMPTVEVDSVEQRELQPPMDFIE